MDRGRIERSVEPSLAGDAQSRASNALSCYVTDAELFYRNVTPGSVLLAKDAQSNVLACESGKDDDLRSSERPISGKDDDLRSNSTKSPSKNNDTGTNRGSSSGKDGDLDSNAVASPGKDD